MFRIATRSFSLLNLIILMLMNIGADRVVVSQRIPAESVPNGVPTASVELLSVELIRSDQSVALTPAELPKKQFWMEVTAYCPCQRCCGPAAHGVTASGLPVSHNAGRFVAADTRILPFGSHVVVPGYHDSLGVPVIDRGGAIKGNKLDVFFPTHDEALQWGRRMVLVAVDAD